MKTLSLGILSIILLCLTIVSCKKSDKEAGAALQPKGAEKSVYQFIKKLGYSDAEIKDIGEEYLVDGDILFAKNKIPSYAIFQEGPKTEQYGTVHYVGYNKQPNVTVRIDPSMNAYASEINGAIALWNNVPNCRVNFVLTSATNQDILITNSNLGAGVCGAAYFPVDGKPGQLIRININQIAGNSFLQRQRTIAHEFGHAIGFRHTNWQGSEPESGVLPDNGAKFTAQQLLGTPIGGDPSSLMNGGQCGTGAVALSNYDIVAVQFLYPENPPAAGTIPIFRYYYAGTALPDHFFTRDYNDLGDGNVSYSFEGIGFFAFQNQVAGSVPVYRFYYEYNNSHFYTTNYNEGAALPGYVFERVEFYAYPSSINSALPVHRYYSASEVDFFYTKNQNESSMPGYAHQGIAFYAY